MAGTCAEVPGILVKQGGEQKTFKEYARLMVGEQSAIALAIAFHALAVGRPVVRKLRPTGVKSGVGEGVRRIRLAKKNFELLLAGKGDVGGGIGDHRLGLGERGNRRTRSGGACETQQRWAS